MRCMPGVWGGATGAMFCGAGALMAYGVRGRSATLFAPSVYRGPAARRAIALTFDDGPGLQIRPDVEPTLDAVRRLLPILKAEGYRFETVSQLICPTN